MRSALAVGLAVALLTCSCQEPDCPAICQQSLSCDVTFTPADDPNLRQVESGARSAQESCELGCRESLAVVDQATQDCVLQVPTQDPTRCRQQILGCLGRVDAGN